MYLYFGTRVGFVFVFIDMEFFYQAVVDPQNALQAIQESLNTAIYVRPVTIEVEADSEGYWSLEWAIVPLAFNFSCHSVFSSGSITGKKPLTAIQLVDRDWFCGDGNCLHNVGGVFLE